ncbi:hypothetical protein, partial [Bacillus sp. 71mf]|uniref:hypothetical protein n=1 Tax=Bacillus sp. 71mf TaxID=1761757 RepID=UPI000B82DCEC
FLYDPAPAARTVGGFASSAEAKSASMSEAPSSSCSERAASAFLYKLLLCRIQHDRYYAWPDALATLKRKRVYMSIF